MSCAKHRPKERLAPYEMLSEWDEVLLGDGDLFNEMTRPHMSVLLYAARRDIERERRQGNVRTNSIQPEDLISETLLQAWWARHGRSPHKPLKDWLLEVQAHTLQKLLADERRIYEPIAVSLEEPAPLRKSGKVGDESEWPWDESSVPDLWMDMIPDANAHPFAA